MNTVVVVLAVALSDAIGDLWRILRNGPVAMRSFAVRLLRQALLRALAVVAWLVTTATLAALWAEEIRPIGLVPVLAAALTPLLLSGLELAPHIGPALYAVLHVWVIVRLVGRLQELYAVGTVQSACAVMGGAAGYWLVRVLSGRRRTRTPAVAGGV